MVLFLSKFLFILLSFGFNNLPLKNANAFLLKTKRNSNAKINRGNYREAILMFYRILVLKWKWIKKPQLLHVCCNVIPLPCLPFYEDFWTTLYPTTLVINIPLTLDNFFLYSTLSCIKFFYLTIFVSSSYVIFLFRYVHIFGKFCISNKPFQFFPTIITIYSTNF